MWRNVKDLRNVRDLVNNYKEEKTRKEGLPSYTILLLLSDSYIYPAPRS